MAYVTQLLDEKARAWLFACEMKSSNPLSVNIFLPAKTLRVWLNRSCGDPYWTRWKKMSNYGIPSSVDCHTSLRPMHVITFLS